MANQEKVDVKKKKGKGGFAALMIILILVVGFIALVKLDVFGLGSNILGPSLREVPVLNLILPAEAEEIIAPEVIEINYQFETVEEAIEVIKERDKTLKEMTEQAEINSEAYDALVLENQRLKVFEAEQVKFQANKDTFDSLVAEQADPTAYMALVETAYPENALAIYSELVKDKVFSEEVMANAQMYASMKPADAAAIMEITHLSDMEMVSEILLSIDSTKAGAILAAMDPTIADRISRYMYPDE